LFYYYRFKNVSNWKKKKYCFIYIDLRMTRIEKKIVY